ncbi:MAG: mannose-1-phosphate guanylyltransferase [Firmicutes bacterium HGW-Firmicutes-14]|nr:MAG: mannose-1-phosphate guanylyltransferase [Firmicutes bacterium HGW-Firmicutes-14]
MVCAVIMAGGRGERFWPKSRAGRPKQFTDLTGRGNMLYLTYRRMAGLVPPERIFVVTGSDYEGITKESIPGLPAENIIIEPEGRNTAPCIGLAAAVLEKRFPGDVMVVVPADHLVGEEDKFTAILKTGVEIALATDGLVTMGIRPTRPETGYGYLKVGEQVEAGGLSGAYRVERFVEKPDPERARQFLEEGGYLWNSGIFIWRTPVILGAFKTHLPDIYEGLMELKEHLGTERYPFVLEKLYPGFDKVSIDYGIMEKADPVFMVPGDFSWDDVGTWQALERILDRDGDGNVLQGRVVALNTRNTIADAGRRLIALVGVEDLVVVDTDDITFICRKEETDMVRELLNELRRQKMEEYL